MFFFHESHLGISDEILLLISLVFYIIEKNYIPISIPDLA